MLPRGGGTSQSGQTVNEALVLDTTKYLNRIIEIDAGEPALRRRAGHRARRAEPRAEAARPVVPGRRLDRLARHDRRHGGQQFLRHALHPLRHDARQRACRSTRCCRTARALHFGRSTRAEAMRNADGPDGALFRDLLALGEREADEIDARFPKVLRRVGGYNIDALVPDGATNNLAHLLVGSEGTLALSTRLELKLSPLLRRSKTLGVCHFARFYDAMDAAQHLVTLDPVAVELVDRTMIELARDIAMFRADASSASCAASPTRCSWSSSPRTTRRRTGGG